MKPREVYFQMISIAFYGLIRLIHNLHDQSIMEYLENEHTLKAGKKEYLIIPRGDFDHPEYGKLEVGDNMMDEMLSNFNNSILGEKKPFIDKILKKTLTNHFLI